MEFVYSSVGLIGNSFPIQALSQHYAYITFFSITSGTIKFNY